MNTRTGQRVLISPLSQFDYQTSVGGDQYLTMSVPLKFEWLMLALAPSRLSLFIPHLTLPGQTVYVSLVEQTESNGPSQTRLWVLSTAAV